ncbi:DUF3748 domain-containing protein [Rhodopirellula sallentina]|uniref:ATP/GTP-binding protein n=1 Tax=Rhodopirellula sallentina SM41 TaxID=1263870 RepID=M5U9I8_9BACT|nr:DUF3748 domain-containing protein [Rhodopirellula sallentina]EMI58085.1 hypothetical protein RSSM_00472 [Rhodopirellula sallentina SM41]
MNQLTQGSTNHLLTNTAVWSPDGQWIYFDARSDPNGSVFDSPIVGRVNAVDRRTEILYRSQNDAHVGVVTASPTDDRIVFIHGPEHPDSEYPTEQWSYNAFHRRGVLLDTHPPTVDSNLAAIKNPDAINNLDARDLTPPFTPGALRGGTHVHVFSGDGRLVSFTYEDHVLANSEDPNVEQNRRGVGVSISGKQVCVPQTHPRNHGGTHFSVLVTRTWDAPDPGSDQISRAYSDAWVGDHGYLDTDGRNRRRAIAFLGDCITGDGQPITELFIVDLPRDLTLPGDGPLQGTESTRPSPPAGIRQRRLTHTSDRKFPGVFGVRHWPRSSPDGERIAFLMRDDRGVSQLWLVSPRGGPPQQLTDSSPPIQSAFTFRSDGKRIACVIDSRVCEVDTQTGEIQPLTPAVPDETAPLSLACVYNPSGTQIAFLRRVPTPNGPRNHIFTCPT